MTGLKALRKQFPALEKKIGGKRLVYFDNACTALKPASVIEAMSDFYREEGVCGGKRSTHLLAQKVEARLVAARQATADFLNAESPNEIVFTSGTTESINMVARAFPYEPGRREVILTDLEHNSVLLPFYEAQERGEIELRVCATQDGVLDLNALDAMITPKTVLVALAHSSNVFGGALPAAEVCRMAHRKGASVLVDAAQYLATHREDVQTLGADLVVFSAHKLGGPFGVGVLYGKETLLNRMRHAQVGGGTVKDVLFKDGQPRAIYLDAPMRFEAGIGNYAGIVGWDAALRWRQTLAQDELRAHVGRLVSVAAERLAGFCEIRVLGHPENLAKGSLVSFTPVHPGFSAADFNLFLNHELAGHFVAVRAGEHCAHLLHKKMNIVSSIRLSFFAYNTEQELSLFFDALESYTRAACRLNRRPLRTRSRRQKAAAAA